MKHFTENMNLSSHVSLVLLLLYSVLLYEWVYACVYLFRCEVGLAARLNIWFIITEMYRNI